MVDLFKKVPQARVEAVCLRLTALPSATPLRRGARLGRGLEERLGLERKCPRPESNGRHAV